MNVFGAFTFGSLIKTFLPGFVLLLALIIFEGDIFQLFGGTSYVWTYLGNKENAALALTLAIPASILLGLLSNIIIFMGMNDWLVRRPFERTQPELFKLHIALAQRIRTKCRDSLDITEDLLERAFDKHVDSEYLLLRQIGVQEFAFFREQYWYYLEFQLNMLLSVTVFAIALALSITLNVPSLFMRSAFLLGCLGGTAALVWVLLVAARKNYARHIAKVVTLIAAVLGSPGPQKASNIRWLRPCAQRRRQCCPLS